ncbi:MAG: 3-isopropylmalate dehydratase large subunit [Pseudomonadota bacterium]
MTKTLFEKVWERNLVAPETEDRPAVLHISLHLIHEVTTPQAFTVLNERGLNVRRPDLTLGTIDHSVPTLPAGIDGELPYATPAAKNQVETLRRNCAEHGIPLLDLGDGRRGIVHVVGPELGRTRPGMTIVCGDSHTSTHGAFGALAFGIGTTEVGHVLATQSLLQRKPKTMRIRFVGTPPQSVTGKDLALAMIRQIGTQGGTGYVLEYTGEAIETLSMEGRMTLCNMSIEAGARAGMIAPDDTTWQYLDRAAGVPIPREVDLRTDDGAVFDAHIDIDASAIRPMVTFGTAPDAAVEASGIVPSGSDGLDYMGFKEGQALAEASVTTVFVGSCTNGRIEDMRAAAQVLNGRRVAEGVRMLVVPGSEQVKRQAEQEGLSAIFEKAGAEWREPGCSMCIAMNGDRGKPGDLVVSTSNRNFKGRQGEGVRTVLASPYTAAASAVEGRIASPEDYV